MRDYETIETAITAAETGHLVLSTLHTLDATETINRIISVFPPHQQKQIRLQLSGVLKAVISMRLVPRADGHGRVPAVEAMIATPFIRDCIINKDKTKLIHEAIAAGVSQYGMQTFDQSIFQLYKKELITYDEALRRASNPDEFKLKIQGIQSTSDMAAAEMEKTMQSFDMEETSQAPGRPGRLAPTSVRWCALRGGIIPRRRSGGRWAARAIRNRTSRRRSGGCATSGTWTTTRTPRASRAAAWPTTGSASAGSGLRSASAAWRERRWRGACGRPWTRSRRRGRSRPWPGGTGGSGRTTTPSSGSAGSGASCSGAVSPRGWCGIGFGRCGRAIATHSRDWSRRTRRTSEAT